MKKYTCPIIAVHGATAAPPANLRDKSDRFGYNSFRKGLERLRTEYERNNRNGKNNRGGRG